MNYRVRVDARQTVHTVLALNLHRYGPQRIETGNQIVYYPAETDAQANAYATREMQAGLAADWRSLVAASFDGYERMPVVHLPNPKWTADTCCAMELPRGNTWSAQGALEQPWYLLCRVNGHEPYGWWSYGMHAHEHLSTFVVNLTEPSLSQAYLRSHLRAQDADGRIQYGVNVNGRNNHDARLATAPLLAFEAWANYGWSGDRKFLAEAYDACGKFVQWWRSPARTRKDLRLQHWIDFIETVRDDADLATWAATGKAEHQEALDLNCYLLNEERTLAAMARELGRADESARWTADADARTQAMRRDLWYADDGVYYGRDLTSGTWARVMDISTFFPMWCGLATPEQADGCVRLLHDPQAFGTAYPIASLAVKHMPDRLRGQWHWRGANWVEMTFLGVQGLRRYGHYGEAARVAEANCRMVFDTLEKTSHFREFYNTITGGPSDLTDYIWASMPAAFIVEVFFGIRPTSDGVEILPALPAGWNDIRIDNLHIRGAVVSVRVRRDPSASATTARVNEQPADVLARRGVLLPWSQAAGRCTVEIIQPPAVAE